MSYLKRFHFDNIPFPTDDTINYHYPRRKSVRIIDEVSNYCRFYGGIYLITGASSVGKTNIVNQIADKVKNNDFVVKIVASDNTDFLKSLAQHIGIDEKKNNVDNVFSVLHTIHSSGQNIIIIIDNSEKLQKNQLISIDSFVSVFDYIKIILCGDVQFKHQLKDKLLKNFRNCIVKKYNIKHFSILEAMKYLSYISNSATALNQYQSPFSFFALFGVALTSNRNIRHINHIATMTLKNADDTGANQVKLKNVYYVIRANLELLKENLYPKFQKAFLYILIALSIYFTVKLFVDRYDLIENIQTRQNILRQEQELIQQNQ